MTDIKDFNQFIEDPRLDELIGKNSEYYKNKWAKIHEAKCSIEEMSFTPSWNWWAFFGNYLWLFYRRLNLWAVIACFAITLINQISSENILAAISGNILFMCLSFVPLILSIIIGVYGNSLYFKHIHKLLEEENVEETDTGTSWLNVFRGIVAYIALSMAISPSAWSSLLNIEKNISCSSKSATTLVKQIAKEELAKVLPEEVLSSITINVLAIRTTEIDEKLKSCSCAAQLSFKGAGVTETSDITYKVQETDDGKQVFVEVYGL